MIEQNQPKPLLTNKERMALSEILISSRSGDGIPRRRIMELLGTRLDDEFNLFLERINEFYSGIFKVLYDKDMDRCVAVTRVDTYSMTHLDILDERHIALLMFCYYFCLTSRTGSVTFEELHEYFQRSSLYGQRKLLMALERLIKSGYLGKKEEETSTGETKRTYTLTVAGRNAFGEEYLRMILSQSQGGEVSMELVREFFNRHRLRDHEESQEEGQETPEQQSLF